MKFLICNFNVFKYCCGLNRDQSDNPEEQDRLINIERSVINCHSQECNILNSGKFADVYSWYSPQYHKKIAVKIIDILHKPGIDNSHNKTEITILKRLHHPNIITYHTHFTRDNKLYIFQELCAGGELFSYLEKHHVIPEITSREIMKYICRAVVYCHSLNIVHRDLKPENIMFATKKCLPEDIRLIDFGLSKLSETPNIRMKSTIGTLNYMAPEVIMGSYTKKCDAWALGIILYNLLYNSMPFNNQYNIINCNYYRPKNNNIISGEAENLVSKLLVPEKERLEAADILHDPWFSVIL